MLSLAAHAHLAVVDDDVVLLDVIADRYLCVPGGRTLLRPAADRRAVEPAHEAVADALRAAGLQATHRSVRPALPAVPSRDLPEGVAPRMTVRDARRLAGALWDAVWRYRGRPLSEIVCDAPRGPARGGPADTDEVVRLACLFRDAVAWLPLPRKCLIRSFVLLRFLRRSGVGATWVFGVRTWPFSAHCWLQVGDVALDDFAERLVAYEPILAVA